MVASGVRRSGLALGTSALVVAAVLGAATPALAANPTIQVFDATLTEGTGGQAIVAFAVQLSRPAPSAVTFTWGTRSVSTTTSGVDYTAVAGGTKKTIAKGASSTVLVVKVNADAIDEYSETFGVRIAGASGATISDADAIATILDDDVPPLLVVDTPQVVEGAEGASGLRPVTLGLSQPSGKPVSVRVAVTGGSAAIGSDLVGGTTLVEFAPGVAIAVLDVDVVGDAVDEANENFGLTWAAPVNLRLPSRSSPKELLDDDGPIVPEILGSTPVAPSSDALPLLFGLAPAGSTVNVYRSNTCSGAVIASGPAEEFIAAGFAVPMTLNSPNALTVRGVNTVGGEDTVCSASFAYRHDSIAPSSPTVIAVPGTPTQNPTPTVRGIAETNSLVSVYVDTDCTQTLVSSGTAGEYAAAAGLGLGVLTPNVAHTVRVTATDLAGNVSACSPPLTVIIDTEAPLEPTGLRLQGGSTTTLSNPLLLGTAEAGSRVQIYVDDDCSEAAGSFGPADQFATIGITVQPALTSGPHQLFARATDEAGNVGDCSLPLNVNRDTTPPDEPTGLTLLDGTPTDDGAVRVRGTAEEDSTVTVYRDTSGAASDTCDTAVASGTAESFSDSTGLTASPELSEGTYVLRARAVDTFGRQGPCSSDSVTVVVDTTGPAAPNQLQLLGSTPTNDQTPNVRGQAEAGSTITVYLDTAAAGGCNLSVGAGYDVADFAATPGVELDVDLPDDANTLRATATDRFGRTSPCSTDSVDVLVDTERPAAPTGLSVLPGAVTSDRTPTLKGTAAEVGSTIQIFVDNACTGSVLGSGTRAEFLSSGIELNPPDLSEDDHSLYARAVDAAGNTGACSAAEPVTIDITGPVEPTGLTIPGGSPTNDPALRGQVANDVVSVTIFRGGSCAPANAVGSGSASDFESLPGIAVALADGVQTLRAIATDAAGLNSACSADSVALIVDTDRPNAPTGLSIEPGTPTNDRTPALRGTAEAGSVIHVFVDDDDCSEAAGATDDEATFSGPGGIALTSLLDEGTYELRATVTDAAGNESVCSAARTVVIDLTRPVLAGFALVGSSPTNDDTPELTGAVSEAGTVDIYATTDCSGSPVESGSASAFENGLAFSPALGDDSYAFWAQVTDIAGNVGDCEGPVTVVVDTDPPAAPVLDAIPDGPSPSPIAKGQAEAGSTVSVYLGSSCTGLVATVSAAAFNSPGFALGPLDAGTYTVTARTVDGAGNPSACSAGEDFEVI